MAVTTKKLFPATSNATTTVFSPVGIQLNNQDDLDVYVTLSGGTRVLQLRQSTGSTAQSSHPQVNNTDGLYFPAVSAGTTLYNYTLSTDNNTITFNSALPQGAVVFCERRTRDADSSYTTFASGSTIRATDLNNSSTESNFTAQDGRNKALTIEGVLFRGDQPSTNFVTTDHIVAGTIVTNDIANDSVNADKIPDDTINSEHYVDLSIDTQHIANLNVTTAKIANSNVTTSKIADLNVTRGKLEADAVDGSKLADNAVNTEHYTDNSIQHVHLQNDIIDGDNIQDDVVNSEHIVAGALDNEHYAAGSITADKLNGATVITASEQGSATTNDTSFLTSAAADARFFNISSGDTIKDGDTFPDNDTTIATTAAINDRIIDLVEEVGGFVPIANETSFPTANPDINNGTGTLVSVKSISSTRTPSSGTVTIANGAGTGNTVLITGCGSTVLSAGFGVIVETTSTLHTYAFHRLVPKATEVTTVSGSITNVNTTASNIANVNTVAGDIANVNTVATNIANVNTVAGINANVTTVAGNTTNVNTVAGVNANVTTVAGSISNVNTAATNIASINNASANINSVNNFGDTYQVHSSNPTTDGGGNTLAEGDLYFNTSANRLKVYDGANWVDGVVASGGGAQTTGDTFTGDVKLNDNVNLLVGTHEDLKIVHNGNDSIINDHGTGTLKIQSSGNTKIEVTGSGAAVTGNLDVSSGVDVTGNITVSGNVDGRDVAADGNKLDGISSGAIANVVQDTSPQLGGNLDTNGRNISVTEGQQITFGTSNDLQIYHDGSHSYIKDAGTGRLKLVTSYFNVSNATDSEQIIEGLSDGAVKLYHNGSEKLVTASGGVTVTGNIGVSGTVDGRDVASDGSKLDGIESGSTGDQTAAEIRTLVESASDSNVFTDADHSKLNGIESGATGDQSAAEILTAIKTVDGSGSGLDADTLDGIDSGAFLRSNTADVATADMSFSGGAGAITINGNSDIRLSNGSWTGNSTKIQHHNNSLYLQGGSGTYGIILRDHEGADRWSVLDNGSLYPMADSSYDIGTTGQRVANGYFDTLYGDGSNLTGINTDLVSDTSPQLGGYLDTNGHNIQMLDNNKLRIGTSFDLDIYHDGTDNYIDSKTGNLNIRDTGSGYITMSTNHFHLNSDTGESIIHADANGSVQLMYNNGMKLETTNTGVTITGNCVPEANNTRDLGTSSLRWANIYTNDLNLSNQGSSNDVDGTWGDWTIQEGESDLFLKNNRSGKKYKFNLTEVS